MNEWTREGHGGTGTGAITPDGCAVEVYTRLPAGDEPEVVASAVPAGASLLELGCGAGRLTHPLLERGFAVTAVDESPEMLEHVRGARTVRSSIETLDLGERFDVVLLASFLVHAGDVRVRDALLRACRRHVADGGCVLVQREGEDWHERVPRERRAGDALIRVVSAGPDADPGVSSIRCEYTFPDGTWTQTFRSRRLSGEEFGRALAGAGLIADAYLTEDRTWVRALPVR
ncbi:class I SAM-dependent methyltransferase [Streptomyces carminius]|uniref:class I SAM-dependent methyltransferase n=1 Tax=Streptomyces carminius TaxID=2665496 RepID=UPI001E47C6DC|nr:class I SAM-dependent methyltransferase [Streptomyces carminius]